MILLVMCFIIVVDGFVTETLKRRLYRLVDRVHTVDLLLLVVGVVLVHLVGCIN